jgi:hypothetical protein
MRIPFSLHPHQHLLLFVSLVVVNRTGMKWNLSVVLICISFMASVEHCFMYLLTINISSSKNCLLNSFAHLLIGFLCLELFLALCISWILIPYWLNSWQRFSPIIWVVS